MMNDECAPNTQATMWRPRHGLLRPNEGPSNCRAALLSTMRPAASAHEVKPTRTMPSNVVASACKTPHRIHVESLGPALVARLTGTTSLGASRHCTQHDGNPSSAPSPRQCRRDATDVLGSDSTAAANDRCTSVRPCHSVADHRLAHCAGLNVTVNVIGLGKARYSRII